MPTVDQLLKEAHSTDDDDVALAKYLAALELDVNDSRIHYNIGLIHKYRGQWRDSFKYNKRAFELDPEDDASRWNLAIAATALRDWKTARDVWKLCGMKTRGRGGADRGQFRHHADPAESGWRSRSRLGAADLPGTRAHPESAVPGVRRRPWRRRVARWRTRGFAAGLERQREVGVQHARDVRAGQLQHLCRQRTGGLEEHW